MCMTKQTEDKSVKRDYKSRMFTMEYAKEMSIEEAVDRVIDECIKDNILREFLERNRTEARAMSIYEYDQEEHIRLEREDAFADGHKLGREEGRAEGDRNRLVSQIQKKLANGQSVEAIADDLVEDFAVVRRIVKELEQSEQDR